MIGHLISRGTESQQFDFHDLCNRGSYAIIGAHNWSHPPVATLDQPWTMIRHSELFADLLASGDLDVRSLISHRVPVEEAPLAYDMLMADRTQAMGVLFTEWPK